LLNKRDASVKLVFLKNNGLGFGKKEKKKERYILGVTYCYACNKWQVCRRIAPILCPTCPLHVSHQKKPNCFLWL
jgi:hypothetical protein